MHTRIISLTKLAAALVGFHLEIVDRVAIQECLYLFANPFLNIQPCCLHPSNESLENIRSHSGRGGNAAQERLEPGEDVAEQQSGDDGGCVFTK